ncbi:MAG: NAD-dependent epimerase/dehydratase family protein [Sphingomonadales bacterium]
MVTGANGFVGSALVRRLLRDGARVRAMVRPGCSRRNLDGLAAEIVEADLLDPCTWPAMLKDVRALYHVAADYRLWVPNPDVMYRTNVDGSVGLIKAAAAAGVERIVYTSSVATLKAGDTEGGADEETPTSLADMCGHYKRSKFLAEEAVRNLAREDGLPIVIVNPSTPIGPCDMRPTPTGRIVLEAAGGKIPFYVNTGLNIVHVDDVAEGHVLACEKGASGQRYILGGENMTLARILGEITRMAGRRPPLAAIPAGAVLPLAYGAEAAARLLPRWEPFVTVDGVKLARKYMYFRSDKAKRDLGYRPRPAGDALADAFAWFKQAGML